MCESKRDARRLLCVFTAFGPLKKTSSSPSTLWDLLEFQGTECCEFQRKTRRNFDNLDYFSSASCTAAVASWRRMSSSGFVILFFPLWRHRLQQRFSTTGNLEQGTNKMEASGAALLISERQYTSACFSSVGVGGSSSTPQNSKPHLKLTAEL